MAGNQREKEPSVAQGYVEAIDEEEKEDDQELNRQRSRLIEGIFERWSLV